MRIDQSYLMLGSIVGTSWRPAKTRIFWSPTRSNAEAETAVVESASASRHGRIRGRFHGRQDNIRTSWPPSAPCPPTRSNRWPSAPGSSAPAAAAVPISPCSTCASSTPRATSSRSWIRWISPTTTSRGGLQHGRARWSARSGSPIPHTIARAVTMMEEYLGRPFRAIMSLEIGGGNAHPAVHGRRAARPPVVDGDCMGRAFPEAQMTSFAIHDLPMYPAHPGRRARQRDRGGARRLLEVDGAAVAQGVRRRSARSRHLQGAAHRQGDQGVRDPLLHEQGDPDRADRPGRAARPPGSDRGPGRGRARPPALHAARSRDVARRATEGFLRGTAKLDGLDALPRPALRARLPERVRGGLARRRAVRDDARPHLRAGHASRATRSARRRCATASGSA